MEFKKEAIRLVTGHGYAIAEVYPGFRDSSDYKICKKKKVGSHSYT